MNLNSFSFIVTFIVILFFFSILQFLRKKIASVGMLQLAFLLVISYYFIIKSDWRFFVCIVLVTFFTYLFGICIGKKQKKITLIVGVILILSFLVYFKYTNFFVNSFRRIVGLDDIALNIILPIGISFYIFSALSYLIDIYRGDYHAEKNIIYFSLYIAFFPKLIAGPIIRGKDFFPQVKEYKGIKWESFKIGIQIFVFGLFKKIVLADHLGVFVDDVFNSPTAFNTGTVILAVISYSLQIYFDFSGYSDMAIGVSKILGFDFNPNFNLPYISQNISEFWKRWHISLSSWFQDYLYIPLGGSRKGEARTYVNLIAVMLISGLWHGAGWTFMIWGALHGILSCLNKAFGKKLKVLGCLVNRLITFIIVSLFWVVFRANSISTAIKIWVGMFTLHAGINQPYTWSFFAIICLIIGMFFSWIQSKKRGITDKSDNLLIDAVYPILDLSKLWSEVAFFTFCGFTIIMGYYGNTVFIYGAF